MAQAAGVDRTGNGWGTRSRSADFGDDVAYEVVEASWFPPDLELR